MVHGWNDVLFDPYKLVLAAAFNKPEVVAGGGCTETLLAGYIRARARAMAGKTDVNWEGDISAQRAFQSHMNSNHLTRGESAVDCDAVDIFASSLEELASATAPTDLRMELLTSECIAIANAGMFPNGLEPGLLKKNFFRPGEFELLGWEKGAGNIVSVASGDVAGNSFCLSRSRVLDFLPAKLETLRKAVETACVALRVESTATRR